MYNNLKQIKMKIFTIKKEFKNELIDAINLFEIKSEFKSFQTNFYAIFKFEFLTESDEQKIFMFIDNIESR